MRGLPLILAAGYVAVLIVRFPQLISGLSMDGDVASAFVLTDAISHGHTGAVVMGTQGAWASLGYGLLTHGLPFHRVIWEISPALLSLLAAAVVGRTVARVGGRSAGWLTVALIVAASPIGLANLLAPWEHNSTMLGTALLGAFLVWLHSSPHRRPVVASCAVALSIAIGVFLASDALLWADGLAPFLIAPVLLALRTRDARRLNPVISVAAGSAVVAMVTSAVMRSLRFSTTAPPLHLDLSQTPLHVQWFFDGLLRMGNGLTLSPASAVPTVVSDAAAVVTICALAAMTRLAASCIAAPEGGAERARSMHVTFWFSALACAGVSYVGTALVPSDRYFLVAIPAVAATVPLLLDRRRAGRVVALGATVFITASIVALAGGESRYANPRAFTAAQAGRLKALVRAQHLGIGYAGYWEAAPLAWYSAGRLRVYPISDVSGHAQPMDIAHVAAWYRPRPNMPSYVLLAPSDTLLSARVPPGFPMPAREYRIDRFTLLAYPDDVASYLHHRP